MRTFKDGHRQKQAPDAWANGRADEIEKLRERTAEFARQIDAQRHVASDEAIQGLERELLQARRDFEDTTRDLQRALEAKQREMLAEVATRVRDLAGE
jgi:hypothetical protein